MAAPPIRLTSFYDIVGGMVEGASSEVDQVAAGVMSSRRYQQVEPGLVRSLARVELARRHSPKEAIKAVKNKLHQVSGAYLDSRMNYAGWLKALEAAKGSGQPGFRQVLRDIMGYHASTRERLPDLERFYPICLAGLPPVHRVLDLACGLNPLAIPWMGLPAGVNYTAVDIYLDMMGFLSKTLPLLGVNGQALAADVLSGCLNQPADLALLLKTIPCLEQLDKSAGERLLNEVQADHLLVSFPLRSLGGRQVGMRDNYENHFLALASGKRWKIDRFIFTNEVVYRISK